jgi:BCCT family betaine/carnitine transporter
VIVFFVTSSDSGSLVIDTITAGGKVDAPVAAARVLGTFEGWSPSRCCSAGGSAALQAMAVSTGFPFTCFAILKGLHSEPR